MARKAAKKNLMSLSGFEKLEVIYNIPINLIFANPKQPRKFFKQDTLEAMAETLRKNKRVEEEIRVTPRGGRFMIVDGERRWRASIMAGLTHVPARIVELDDKAAYLKSGLANFCRDEMTFVEKAVFIRDAMAEYGWNQGEAANHVGLTQAHVSNILRVLRFREEILNRMVTGELEPGLFLSIASYDKRYQLELSKPLEEAVRAKKVTTPNRALRFVRKTAEKIGIRPVTTTRKDRPRLSYSQMVARALRKSAQTLDSEMNEFLRLSHEEIIHLENPSAMGVISLLERLGESIEQAVSSLKDRPLNRIISTETRLPLVS